MQVGGTSVAWLVSYYPATGGQAIAVSFMSGIGWRQDVVVDSPKRAQADKRIVLDENDSEAALPEYHTNGEVFEVVSFRDVVSTLANRLKPREQIVLCALAEGFSVSEIASRFEISRPTVLKDRRTIAALTIRLGISQPLLPLKQNGRSGSPAQKAASDVRRLPAGLAALDLQFL